MVRSSAAAPVRKVRAGKDAPAPSGTASYLSLAGFIVLYLVATWAWRVSPLIAVLYGGASLGCFLVYAIDKHAARKGAQRTPESTLLLMGLACGWPGALLAQQWLRHKSSKVAFRRLFWVTVWLNIGAFAYLSSPISLLRQL